MFSNYSRGQRKSVWKTVGGTTKGPKSTPHVRLATHPGLHQVVWARPVCEQSGQQVLIKALGSTLYYGLFYFLWPYEAASSTLAPRSVFSQGSHTQSWRYLVLNSQDVKSLCSGFHQRKISQAHKKRSHKCHTQMFMNFIIVLLFFFWQNCAF